MTTIKTFEEYVTEVRRTAALKLDNPALEACIHGLGIAGEAGEVADLLKKHYGHGHELDLEKLKKELGDVLWYVVAIADRHGLAVQSIAEANVAKLRARYPNGFSSEASKAREDEGLKRLEVGKEYLIDARGAVGVRVKCIAVEDRPDGTQECLTEVVASEGRGLNVGDEWYVWPADEDPYDRYNVRPVVEAPSSEPPAPHVYAKGDIVLFDHPTLDITFRARVVGAGDEWVATRLTDKQPSPKTPWKASSDNGGPGRRDRWLVTAEDHAYEYGHRNLRLEKAASK